MDFFSWLLLSHFDSLILSLQIIVGDNKPLFETSKNYFKPLKSEKGPLEVCLYSSENSVELVVETRIDSYWIRVDSKGLRVCFFENIPLYLLPFFIWVDSDRIWVDLMVCWLKFLHARTSFSSIFLAWVDSNSTWVDSRCSPLNFL